MCLDSAQLFIIYLIIVCTLVRIRINEGDCRHGLGCPGRMVLFMVLPREVSANVTTVV